MTIANNNTPPAPPGQPEPDKQPKNGGRFPSLLNNVLDSIGLELSIGTIWFFARSTFELDLTYPVALRAMRLIVADKDSELYSDLYISQTLGMLLGLVKASSPDEAEVYFFEWMILDLALFFPLQACQEAWKIIKRHSRLLDASKNIPHVRTEERRRLLRFGVSFLGFVSGTFVGLSVNKWSFVYAYTNAEVGEQTEV